MPTAGAGPEGGATVAAALLVAWDAGAANAAVAGGAAAGGGGAVAPAWDILGRLWDVPRSFLFVRGPTLCVESRERAAGLLGHQREREGKKEGAWIRPGK